MTIKKSVAYILIVMMMIFTTGCESSVKKAERGATVSFKTYEAEDYCDAHEENQKLAQSASGKKAVTLAHGESIAFAKADKANRITVRYSIPYGTAGDMSVLVNGVETQKPALNSIQCHGIDKNGTPDGGVRSYNECTVTAEVPSGAEIKLLNNAAENLTIDLIDTEIAPPVRAMPDGCLSIADFGAAPDDDTDDSDAIEACFKAAADAKKDVFVPEGTFIQSRRIDLPQDVELTGAGIWYSNIDFVTPGTTFTDEMGYALTSGNKISHIHFNDRASFSRHNASIMLRPFGYDQLVENCWISNVGCIAGWDGGMHNTILRACRVIGTYFDGIHWGDAKCYDNIAEDNFFRGLGDDAIAQVNRADMELCENNTARFNTIIASYWGRGITDIGGDTMTISDNVIDSLYLAGIMIATEELGESVSRPVNGLTVERNTISNCGHSGHNHASLHVYLAHNPMRDVIIRENLIENGETDGIFIDFTEFGDSEGATVIQNNTIRNMGGKPYINQNPLCKVKIDS